MNVIKTTPAQLAVATPVFSGTFSGIAFIQPLDPTAVGYFDWGEGELPLGSGGGAGAPALNTFNYGKRIRPSVDSDGVERLYNYRKAQIMARVTGAVGHVNDPCYIIILYDGETLT